MLIKSWNTYKTNEQGKLIVAMKFTDKYTVESAMDQAQREAIKWNKGKEKDSTSRINYISYGGIVRVISVLEVAA